MYEEIIGGPIYVTVPIVVGNKKYEVEAYVTRHATGVPYYEWDTGAGGWTVMTYPTFSFEGFDNKGVSLVFDSQELINLNELALEAYWNEVGI